MRFNATGKLALGYMYKYGLRKGDFSNHNMEFPLQSTVQRCFFYKCTIATFRVVSLPRTFIRSTRRRQNTSRVCEAIFSFFAFCNQTEKSPLTLYLFTYASEHLLGS